uniref:Transposase (Putative), gypsy type n=1 Tax=Tanacetum cinerariifolium TaxID=118510 RepID=A0A6L2MQ05_TANCI|nr:transposase (putative), gypsy type [Tanacetum cinerariifolium]
MFHIPDEVHPQLPSPNQTIHEMPTDKIGAYTRFFKYANFRLPISTFLVNVLKHYRLHISQLAVIGAAKVSHFEILCRVYGFEPTVGLFRCFYVNSRNKGWMSYSKRQEIDLVSFIRTIDPTKVRINKRQRDEDEPKLLETIVGRVVSLLPVTPDRSSGELKASVDNLFDDGGSGEQSKQGDSASDGHGVGIDVVAEPIVEDVDPAQLSAKRNEKPKLLMLSLIQRLFAKAVQNAKVSGGIMPTLPFVSFFVSTTPEREDGDHTELLAGANLHVIGAQQRFIISSESSDHSGVNIAEVESDFVVRTSMPIITSATTTTPTADHAAIAKENLLAPMYLVLILLSRSEVILFLTPFLIVLVATSSLVMVDEFAPLKFFASIHGMDHDQLFTEFNVGGANQISFSAEVRMRAEYHIIEKRRLKAVVEKKNQILKARDEEIENIKARLLLKEAKATKAICLRAETSKLEAAEKSLRDEVTALNERNTIPEKERNALDKVTDLQAVVVSKDRELILPPSLLLSNLTMTTLLIRYVHELQFSSSELKEKLSNYENLTERLEEFQDAQLKVVNDKFDKLYDDFVEVTLHLEERFYPHLLTTIDGRRWLLTHGMEFAIVKCLNSLEYLSALGTTVSKAIEKGIQDGLTARIIHGRKGRVLIDVDAHNPAAEADYVSAMQQLQSVNFSLLAELKANKDASIEAVINILRLKEHLAARENIMSHRSLFQDVFVPLAEPLSAAALTGMEGTFSVAPATVDLTTSLSVTLASADTVTPLSIDDYGVMGTNDQSAVNESVVDEDANPFPNVKDAELNIPQ